MDLTPIKIRGKRRKRGTPAASQDPTPSQVPAKRAKISKPPKKSEDRVVPAMPTLQGLPQELLEMIFLYSNNISLPRSSPDIGQKLSSKSVCMSYFMQHFFYTQDHKANIRQRFLQPRVDPSLQSEILKCRFFTLQFFLDYVAKGHDAIMKIRGKAWESTGVAVPGLDAFENLWPYKFAKVTYLSFAEGFLIPEKLLQGPWTDDKAKLLFILVSLNGEIDWRRSLAGEMAKEGLKEAIKEGNEYAVAALSVLVGIAKEITTEMLRYAVFHCGCKMNILRHLVFNAQILYSKTSRDTLDFLDSQLWQWADNPRNAHQGSMLKDLLKQADAFSFAWYYPDETVWTHLVPFPYSGPRYDVRASFNNINREMLVKLYQNYGRRITENRGVPAISEDRAAGIVSQRGQTPPLAPPVMVSNSISNGPSDGHHNVHTAYDDTDDW